MAVSSDLDIATFVEQLSWLSPRLPDTTRLGVLSWLGARVHPAAASRLKKILPIDHPIQIEAEKAIAKILKRNFQREAPRYRRLDVPDRDVDWPKTYVDAITRPVWDYWVRTRRVIPDLDMLGALRSLATSCVELLSFGELTDAQRVRRDELRSAMNATPALQSLRAVPYTQRHAQRLAAMDAEAKKAAEAIQENISFWRNRFGSNDDHAALARVAKHLQEADIKNIDTLLEVTATLSIARAAMDAGPDDRPLDAPWGISSLSERDRLKCPRIHLFSRDLHCVISKGVPVDPHTSEKKIDTLIPILNDMGFGSDGNQPDIVVTFWREGGKESIAILADAKRNAKGDNDGEGYIRESVEIAAVYMVSYGQRMRLQIHGVNGGIQGPVLPAVTLFCRQGVKHIAGISRADSANHDKVLAALRDPAPLPAVMAFDMVHDFAHVNERPWKSPVLEAWFGRIARQAWTFLQNGAR